MWVGITQFENVALSRRLGGAQRTGTNARMKEEKEWKGGMREERVREGERERERGED